VSFEDTSFFDLLKTKYLSQGIQPLVVVAKMYPPINYLTNLKDFVSNSESELLSFYSHEKSYSPVDIDNDSVGVNYFIDLINSNEIILLQGPPGPGKSYQAAAICDYFIKQK
jgi:SpoVK/Ycf46/Vps4 family AAA+-type ATPase